jgi:hypothetical protein
MSQEWWCVYEEVEVAESRESERDMATEAGAKVEGRMFDVGEEKKCILGGCGVFVCRRCLRAMLGQPVLVVRYQALFWESKRFVALCDI